MVDAHEGVTIVVVLAEGSLRTALQTGGATAVQVDLVVVATVVVAGMRRRRAVCDGVRVREIRRTKGMDRQLKNGGQGGEGGQKGKCVRRGDVEEEERGDRRGVGGDDHPPIFDADGVE